LPPPNFAARQPQKSASREFRGPQAAKKSKIVFSGGVYVGKNTLRGASVAGTAFGGSEAQSVAKPPRLSSGSAA